MYDFSGMKPEIHPETFIAEGVRIIGRVVLARGVSIWYNSVLRADIATITIGENTNIQDACVLHVDFGLDTVLGAGVTVGHGAILHACRVGDNSAIRRPTMAMTTNSSTDMKADWELGTWDLLM